MITKESILSNLNHLDSLFKKSLNLRSLKRSNFYAKLAVLEVCGWIEESMDAIINDCADKHLKDPKNQTYVKDEVIRPTYGFHYQKHFRHMLIQLLGVVNVEKIEANLDIARFQKMKAALGSLKIVRDGQAHTHVRGATKRIDSPSVTMHFFLEVYPGLKDFEKYLRKMKI